MHHKWLKRTTDFIERYDEWLSRDCKGHLWKCQRDFERIAFSSEPEADSHSSLKLGESQSYFIWSPTFESLPNATFETGAYMIDYFAHLLKQYQYVLHNSDLRKVDVEHIGQMEFSRHYLKPPITFRWDGQKRMHYGNIFLEYTPMLSRMFLKITANHYPGEQIHRFEKLMQGLLTRQEVSNDTIHGSLL
jgi:hypothetical protein